MLNWYYMLCVDKYNVMVFFKIVGYKLIRELRINWLFNNVYYFLFILL